MRNKPKFKVGDIVKVDGDTFYPIEEFTVEKIRIEGDETIYELVPCNFMAFVEEGVLSHA